MTTIRKILFLSLLVAFCESKSLSDVVTLCQANDPNLDVCIAKKINEFLPKISKGNKELKILPIDPFTFIKITMDIGTMHLEMTDGKVYGLEKAIIEKAVFDKDAQTLYMEGTLPFLDIKCEYDTSGKLLILAIEGKGPMEVRIENANFTFKIQLENCQPDSKDPINFVSSDFDYSFENAKIKLHKLFNGNKQLSDPIHKLLNEDNQMISSQFKDAFVTAINKVLQTIVIPCFNGRYYYDMLSK